MVSCLSLYNITPALGCKEGSSNSGAPVLQKICYLIGQIFGLFAQDRKDVRMRAEPTLMG